MEEYMIRVGALVFCKECYDVEFSELEFSPDSDNGSNYYTWLKKWDKLYS